MQGIALLAVLLMLGTAGSSPGHTATTTSERSRAAVSLFHPTWSSDGRRIAWTTTDLSIWVATADGGNARAVTGGIDALGKVRWLPDEKLVYWANSRLFVLTPGRRSSLLLDPAGDGFTLDARATRVATGAGPCGIGCVGPVVIKSLAGWAAWTIGGGKHGGKYAQDTSPTFSPDGSRIAFSRYLCDNRRGCSNAGIWVSPTAGGALEQITPTGGCPAWSPDGSRLIYVTDGSLRVVPAGGGASRVVLRDVGCNSSFPPSWAPDSRSVAAVDAFGQRQGKLVIADVTTRRSRVVTGLSFGAVTGFSWSPDSSELLVTASPTPNTCSSLWIVSATRLSGRLLRRCR